MLLVRLMLATTAFVVVIVDTTESSQVRQEIATKDRQFIDKDESLEHRQGRMALHAEPPSSKAKREQTLKNVLAARRRQILSPRALDASRNFSASIKSTKSVRNTSKDPLDMLEAQETRHGVFVTVPMGDQAPVIVVNEEDAETIPAMGKGIESTNETSTIIHPTLEPNDNSTISHLSTRNASKNGSQVLTRPSKNPDEPSRRKNTVVMPESLYNHFRPVESNIPVEDMTQFLYFGQKIHPENTTSNNSVEVTSASPTSPNSRRRFSMKRFSTTTAVPFPQLEEILNEEMNIAVEKSTIERNKIPKMKNVFRNTGLYSRKPATTIASNTIIPAKNISGLSTVSDSNSSAHANQMVTANPAGGSTAHRSSITPDSTHIPERVNGTESEILDVTTTVLYPAIKDIMSEDYQSDDPHPNPEREKPFVRNKKSQTLSEVEGADLDGAKKGKKEPPTSTEPSSVEPTTQSEESRTRLSTWMSVDPVTSSTTDSFNELTSSIPTTSSSLNQHHSSLRIVVTEPSPSLELKSAQDPVSTVIPNRPTLSPAKKDPSLLSQASVAPSPVPSVKSTKEEIPLLLENESDAPPVASMQQMYPYAYTITNVTRLLRNYTGPGPIETTTMTTLTSASADITTKEDTGLLPPLPVDVGIDSMRERVGASAESAAVQTSLPVERVRKTHPHRLVSSTFSESSNSSVSTTTEKFDAITATNGLELGTSTLRWNYTNSRGTEKDSNGDRRFLRKSASAVLNQRTNEEGVREFKRRRPEASGRRVKSPSGEERLSASRSMENKTLDNEGGNKTLNAKDSASEVMRIQGQVQTTMSPQTILDQPPKTMTDPLVNLSEKEKVNSTIPSDSENLKNVDTHDGPLSTPSVFRNSTKNETPSSTAATPIFRVTPVMIDGFGDFDNQSQTNPITTDGSLIAKELEPSEVQKMYRSQTTLKPESPITTILPEFVTQKAQGMTSKSSERSPEVRGRNLSDKSKDKDDILPIMHLYNTSDIFNGTMKASENSPPITTLPPTPETSPLPKTSLKPLIDVTSMKTTIRIPDAKDGRTGTSSRANKNRQEVNEEVPQDSNTNRWPNTSTSVNKTRSRPTFFNPGPPEYSGYHPDFNESYFEPGMISLGPRDPINISGVITKRHDGDALATQETVTVISYILATLVVFPIAVGVGLILRRLIIRNRKVLEESDTSSEISCRKDALNLENGDFKTSIEKAITKLPRIQHLCHEAEKPPPPQSQESRWEFPRDKLRLQTVLGQGNFGQVWKAEADDLTGHQGTTRLVAVKTVKEGASAREKEDLVRELEIMQQLGNHPNVVTLLGCCTEQEPHYLILEYVMYGKLLAYLRDHRTRQDFYNFSEDSAALTSRDLTVFGYCVARGMEYLASKKIIHRDLAARNVLVDHNKLCKIADFGMSRFANEDGECVETRHGRNALPIRWMAPESLIYSLFTTKTDVWSFGILMWEIVTLGSTPYPDMAAREVMRNVQNGYRLERPSHCRSELFRVIARCWHADPDRRPEFQTLRRDLAQLLEDNMNGHYVDLESFASECTD